LSWGFDTLIFDDNLPAHGLHGDVVAPYPTVDMVLDDDFAEGELIEWQTESRFRYMAGKTDLAMLRQRIAFAERFPDLARETGYQSSNLTYVRLASRAVDQVDADDVKQTRGVR
jgi:hypothetical protein